MKSTDRTWDLNEFIGLVVFGGPTAIYCYWIGHTIFEIIHSVVTLYKMF